MSLLKYDQSRLSWRCPTKLRAGPTLVMGILLGCHKVGATPDENCLNLGFRGFGTKIHQKQVFISKKRVGNGLNS